MGCQRAEKVIPMLNRCTVFPAIHIMKPIISKFLKGACATSQAFCLHIKDDVLTIHAFKNFKENNNSETCKSK
jgi:hypothetical protein